MPEDEIRERTYAEGAPLRFAGRGALRRAFRAEGSGTGGRPFAFACAIDLTLADSLDLWSGK